MNNDVKKLYETIKLLVKSNALEVEFEACIKDISKDPNAEVTVADLNDYLRESMSYWEKA
jgi:uncharacterized protein YeeX (DUF496 family)